MSPQCATRGSYGTGLRRSRLLCRRGGQDARREKEGVASETRPRRSLNSQACTKIKECLYGTEESFSTLIRCIPCLAFLPHAEILNTFNILKTLFPPEAEIILNWFDKYYVNSSMKQRPNGRVVVQLPLFPPDMWSVHDNEMNVFQRTQTPIESWHRRWQCS